MQGVSVLGSKMEEAYFLIPFNLYQTRLKKTSSEHCCDGPLNWFWWIEIEMQMQRDKQQLSDRSGIESRGLSGTERGGFGPPVALDASHR